MLMDWEMGCLSLWTIEIACSNSVLNLEGASAGSAARRSWNYKNCWVAAVGAAVLPSCRAASRFPPASPAAAIALQNWAFAPVNDGIGTADVAAAADDGAVEDDELEQPTSATEARATLDRGVTLDLRRTFEAPCSVGFCSWMSGARATTHAGDTAG